MESAHMTNKPDGHSAPSTDVAGGACSATPGLWQFYWRLDEEGHADCGVFSEQRKGHAVSVCRAPKYEKKKQWEANASLIAAAPSLLTTTKIAYTILADIRHQWAGRHTQEGQAALSAMRDAICAAENRDPQEVQDEYTNANLARATAKG